MKRTTLKIAFEWGIFSLYMLMFLVNVHAQYKLKTDRLNYMLDGGKRVTYHIAPEVKIEKTLVYATKGSTAKVLAKSAVDSVWLKIRYGATATLDIDHRGDHYQVEITATDVPQSTISATDRMYTLGRMWATAKYDFVGMDQLRFNWDSLYLAFIPKVMDVQNDYDFFQLLSLFYGALSDGHTDVWGDSEFYAVRDYIPVLLQDIGKDVYLVAINKRCSLDSSFVGAQVLDVGGIPLLDYLTKKAGGIAASTDHVRFSGAVAACHMGFKKDQFETTLRKRDGRVVKVSLPYNGESTRTVNDSYWGKTPQRPKGLVSYEWLDDKYIKVQVAAFYPEDRVIQELIKIVPEINRSKGLILDLRNNRGGSTGVAHYLQSAASPQDKKWLLNFGWQTRINDGVKKAVSNMIPEYKDFFYDKAVRTERPDTIPIHDTLERIRVPMIILVNRYTASAAEDLLVNLYELPNHPLLIGERTNGSTGSPFVLQGLPNGWGARVCTRRVLFPYSMKPFVGGIEPDINVSYTIDEYLSNVDKEVAVALQELKKK